MKDPPLPLFYHLTQKKKILLTPLFCLQNPVQEICWQTKKNPSIHQNQRDEEEDDDDEDELCEVGGPEKMWREHKKYFCGQFWRQKRHTKRRRNGVVRAK
jgi:hypothetical protein